MRYNNFYLVVVLSVLYIPYCHAQVTENFDIIRTAQLAYDQKNYDAAEKLYLEALSNKMNKSLELDSIEANCLLWLGQTYNKLHQYRQAIDKFWKAEEIFEKICDDTSTKKCISCYNNIGYSYSKLAEFETEILDRDSLYEKSISFYEQALELCGIDGNKEEQAASYFNIGVALYNMEEFEEALNFYFAKSEKLFIEAGANSEELAKVYSAKATVYFLLGKKNAQTALETLMKKFPANHPACRRAKQDLDRFK